jgi:hypothetical protein
MTAAIKIIKNNQDSKELLEQIFNSSNSPISCENYGKGGHCEKGVEGKLKLWGNKGDNSNENECKLARVLIIDDEPAALFNIGVTGSSPTVSDRTVYNYTNISFIDNFLNQVENLLSNISSSYFTKNNVYEFSGIFIVDKFLGKTKTISDAVGGMANVCKADDGFTKAFLTIKKDHPYQKDIFLGFDGKELTCDNYVELLGENSFHPERLKCEDGKFKECISEDKSEKVKHSGWHESDNCVNFVEKTAFVFDMNQGHFNFDHSEL